MNFRAPLTGERIRDKIAASTRKGMWMGGSVPTGYLVRDRTLIVAEPQAALVRHIMQRYIELSSVVELIDDHAWDGYRSEAKVSENGGTSGGMRFGRGMLYRLLANPVYRGITVREARAMTPSHSVKAKVRYR